jgi:hypothetical protein
MWLVNRACEVQMASASMGELIEIPEDVLNKCVRDSLNFNPKFGAGKDAVAAFTRIIEKIDPSYKE